MNRRSFLSAVFSGFGLLALILDGKTALMGASEGLELCLRTVVPSLFPFLFLCGILTDALWGGRLRLLRPLGRLMGIPQDGESLLISAFLGGYPAGAQAIGQAYRTGRLEKQDASRLLAVCSNAGPAFLFGMVGQQFSSPAAPWALWGITMLSALLTGLKGIGETGKRCSFSPKKESVSEILTRTVKTMGVICGWIVLFRTIFALLQRWILWILPGDGQILLSGLLELSSGCCGLGGIPSEERRFLICSLLLSFGGLCVVMQTASVIGSLPLGAYLWGKLRQSGYALLLSFLYLRSGSASLGIAAAAVLLFAKFRKKRWIFPGFRCIMPVSPPGGNHHAVS